MSSPSISCITVTFGRVELLNEVVQCFLDQQYDGWRELVILNTFPRQQLQGNFPNVKIINCTERPQSLGAARNMAIEAASGSVILTMDDDDLYLPNHLSNFAKYFTDDIEWVWLNRQFYMEGWQIKKVTHGIFNLVGYRKSAWERAGKFPALTVGEDRLFVSQLTQATKGLKVDVADDAISFLYHWGQGAQVYHVSGMGDDRQGESLAHDRIAKHLEERIAAGYVPIGEVELKPTLQHDYAAMARQYLDTRRTHASKKNRVVIVELGRYGDIINVLPIALHIHNTYAKPYLMVSREFASLLDGVSYVEPFVVPLNNNQLNEALIIARKEFDFVVQTQIWGKEYQQERRCRSFNEESWRQAGFLHEFENPQWRPLFDSLDEQRAALFADKLIDPSTDRFNVVANLTHSASSPFDGMQLLEELKRRNPTCNFIDTGKLRAERIYDLIPLIEYADLVLSIDTALLHLAAATDTPIVALVNEKPWLGSIPRGNLIERIPYAEATVERVEARIGLIRALKYPPKRAVTASLTAMPAPPRHVLHVVERHIEENPKERMRKEEAQSTWDVLYSQSGVIPCHIWKFGRNATSIGEPRELPFLKDVLSYGMSQAGDDDVIMFTNDDIGMHPGLADIVKFQTSLHGAVCSQRCEFQRRPFPPLDSPPETIARFGGKHMGRDMFAFTRRWLIKHWDQIPDFVLGCSEWDLCLAAMIRVEKGIRSNRQNLEDVIPPCELPKGYIWHMYHPPKWAQAQTSPAQLHNRLLFKEWAREHLPELVFHSGNVI